MRQHALRILWPAFVAAGVLEAVVFAIVDPADLHWFSGPPIAWSSEAVYTAAFLMFWAATAAASAVSALLSVDPDRLNALQQSR